ncbi:MAG: molybdopterin-dependent oxidoreductase [Alphaproteobacteria bacterium]
MPFGTTKSEILRSTCPHDCPSVCALEVERLDAQRIGKVRGAKTMPYTAGVICAKVARYAERVHHPARLRTPLRRIGLKGCGPEGFIPLSWDDALDEIAEQFTKAAQRYGTETVWPFFYAGTMGLVQRDGIERLRHVMRYSQQHSTYCVALSNAGWAAGVGDRRGVNALEIPESDLIVIWGGNPVNTQVNVMTLVAKAQRRGAKLVVIDPYRTGTAEQADMHLAVRPGTDAALACAVMHIAFREGRADRAYMAKYTDDPAALEAHVATRDPKWAAKITGLAPKDIEAFADLYTRTAKSFIRIGYGFSRSRNGAQQLHAVSCLPAVTGAWQHRGGGALYSQSGLYGLNMSLIKGLDALDPTTRILDQSRIGSILCGNKDDLGAGPPVTALLIQNTNPMVVAPDTHAVKRGFMRNDLFTCVHEQFLTDTARMADIVLPATTFLEHDDFYVGSGHTYLQVAKAIIAPYAECRSNHDVICTLAKRLGATHPGFSMTSWELLNQTLLTSGYPSAEEIHAMGWYDRAVPEDEAHFRNGFAHKDGKFRFKADWRALGANSVGLSALPDHVALIDAPTPEHPFRLVAAPARTFLNTSFTETPGSQARERRPTAKIHPQDCDHLGLKPDSLVRIGNHQGSILIHIQPSEGQQPGVVVIESLWPNDAFIEKIGVNSLISADPGRPNGGGVFHDTAVWLRAV